VVARKPALEEHAFGSIRVMTIEKGALAPLTDAERDVVLLVLVGLSNKEVASRRSCSARTVANQLASAYRKLAVGSRGELVARLQGLEELG
jgi:DNA-binding CsgD family transcriptional regulator